MHQCFRLFRPLWKQRLFKDTYGTGANFSTMGPVACNIKRNLSKYTTYNPFSEGKITQVFPFKCVSDLFTARCQCPAALIVDRGFHSTQVRRIEEDKHTKDIAVWNNLRALKASPLPALTLGLSGLIPFAAAPLYMISSGVYMPDVAFAQLAYGASILSFLGGVRWGFVLPEENPIQPNWVNLGYSVTPSLIAWLGLLMPQPVGVLTVTAGLAFAAYADMAMFGYPRWFKGMRFLLSLVAILSLWSTFMCSFVMSTENKPNATEEVE